MENKIILIGYTGFVGSNLMTQTTFSGLYNSSNISDSFGTNPDILIYSGVRAEKFLANNNPEKDFDLILGAIENIKKIEPKKVILISTVDVYPNPINVDETTNINSDNTQAYGKNRLYLEKWVEDNYPDHLILRLPALFGENLKKNLIYDIIHLIPSMLTKEKFEEINNDNWLNDFYTLQANGFYKLNAELTENEIKLLKKKFTEINFTALNFTDSRAKFQFYNLNDLWQDINIAIKNNIKKLNLATEPISANEVYQSVYQSTFENHINNTPPNYNFFTIHSNAFGKEEKYIRTKEEILENIKTYILKNI